MIHRFAFALLAFRRPSVDFAAQVAPPQAASADGQLKALYDAYARWDAKEGGYGEDAEGEQQALDYLPRVDAAAQERRAAFRQRHVDQAQGDRSRPTVAGREGQCGGVPNHPRERDRQSSVSRVRNAVQQRQQLLDLPRLAERILRRRRIPPLHRADARPAALLRRAGRQHARRSGAWLLGAEGDACRSRPVDRQFRHRHAGQERLLCGVPDHAVEHSRGGAGAASRRRSGGNRSGGDPGLSQAARLLSHRISSQGQGIGRRA